jgi:hypothetical protein
VEVGDDRLDTVGETRELLLRALKRVEVTGLGGSFLMTGLAFCLPFARDGALFVRTVDLFEDLRRGCALSS